MLSLHTNSAALSAQHAISRTQKNLTVSMTRLSTGYRINSAMDDAAGLQIATRLSSQTSGMKVAMRNTQNSISMMQTAEGAFDEVTAMLTRMKDLAIQAGDASSTSADKTAMQAEYDQLGVEINNIMNKTSFGGGVLLKGGTIASSMSFQIGSTSAEQMTVDLSAQMTTLNTSLGAATANYAAPNTVGTELTASANATIDLLNTAITSVGGVRAALGAASNRLDHVFNNLTNMTTNTSAAKGRIMDADYASESAEMTSEQMMLQASTSMLKQTGAQSALVLSLLQ